MDDLVGPLSEGNVLLQLAVLLGLGFAVLGWGVSELLGVSVPASASAWLPVGALMPGVVAVFGGHVVRHYNRG